MQKLVRRLLSQKLEQGEVIGYEEVKGYMSIKDAAKATNTELKEIYNKFAIPDIVKKVPGYDFDK